MTRLSRRDALRIGTGASAASLLGGTLRAARAQQGPLVIPTLMPLSGPLAVIGMPAKLGAEITADLINRDGGIAGRQIKLDVIDDKGSPNNGIAALREVIGNGANLISGLLISNQIQAALPVLNETRSVLVSGGGTSLAFGHELFTPYLFRCLDDDYTRANGLAKLCVERFPDVQHFGAVISETAPFIAAYESFRKLAAHYYAGIGKQPVFMDPVLFKYGTNDFRTGLAQFEATPIDAMFNFVIGADAITCWSQARSFPFVKRLKLVADQVIEMGMAHAMSKSLPPNLWTQITWYSGLHTQDPLSVAVVDEYTRRTGDKFPPGWIQHGSTPIAAIAAALRANGGKTDSETFIHTLPGMTVETVRGKLQFRKEDNTLLAPLDFIRLEPNDDEPLYKVTGGFQLPGEALVEPASPGKKFEMG